MSENRITNWPLAVADNVPAVIVELRSEVDALEARRDECLSLIHDLTDMLSIARRRVPPPAPPTTEPTTRPA